MSMIFTYDVVYCVVKLTKKIGSNWVLEALFSPMLMHILIFIYYLGTQCEILCPSNPSYQCYLKLWRAHIALPCATSPHNLLSHHPNDDVDSMTHDQSHPKCHIISHVTRHLACHIVISPPNATSSAMSSATLHATSSKRLQSAMSPSYRACQVIL